MKANHSVLACFARTALGGASLLILGCGAPPADPARAAHAAPATVATDLGAAIDLGAAVDLVMLARTALSTIPSSTITGDIGLSPAGQASITGFALCDDPAGNPTSSQVDGAVLTNSSPAIEAAVHDMHAAYDDAAARAVQVGELGGGDIGAMTLAAGVYHFSAGARLAHDVTFAGSADDVWIVQVNGDLLLNAGTRVVLAGDARAENITWQVSGVVDVGAAAHLEGTILAKGSITLAAGASINGRLLGETSVDVDASTISLPLRD